MWQTDFEFAIIIFLSTGEATIDGIEAYIVFGWIEELLFHGRPTLLFSRGRKKRDYFVPCCPCVPIHGERPGEPAAPLAATISAGIPL